VKNLPDDFRVSADESVADGIADVKFEQNIAKLAAFAVKEASQKDGGAFLKDASVAKRKFKYQI